MGNKSLFDESENTGRSDTQSLEEMPNGAGKMVFRKEETIEYMPKKTEKELKLEKKYRERNQNAIRRMAGEDL